MLEQTLRPARRTLIFTDGVLAQAAGDRFMDGLASRQGPLAAVTALSSDAQLDAESFAETIAEALTRISPPNLAMILAETGWELSNPAEVCLMLMIDAVPDGNDKAARLLQTITDMIYRHLGVEPTSLLIWLVGNEGEAFVSDCFINPLPATRGVVLLGMRNEAGFRLAEEVDLSRIAADLLWCLTATPLQELPEWALPRLEQSYTGEQPFFTLGLFGWTWHPEAARSVFIQRWLESVLAHWLSIDDIAHEPESIHVWMKKNNLTADAFADCALHEKERHPPDFAHNGSQLPWPWGLRSLFVDLRFAETVDDEALTVYRQQASFRLAEPLQTATSVLQKRAQIVLDDNPIAALAQSKAWFCEFLTVCDFQIELTLDREDVLAETGVTLAEERGLIAERLKAWRIEWPFDTWRAWLHTAARPWKWPYLTWRFWQVWQDARRLSAILTQQAALKRRRIESETARQGVIELSKIAQRIESQVDEVGQMLHVLAKEVADNHIHNKAATSPSLHMPVAVLPVPLTLYEQLVPDEAEEARMAATQLGGLGQLVTKLDDALLVPLRHIAEKRLSAVWELTVIDALSALVNDESEQQKQGLFAWDTACPLWRVDEASLDEMTRSQPKDFAAICGADADIVLTWLPREAGEAMALTSGDREYIWLARVRLGLTASAFKS